METSLSLELMQISACAMFNKLDQGENVPDSQIPRGQHAERSEKITPDQANPQKPYPQQKILHVDQL
jgi:hypothetical protein